MKDNYRTKREKINSELERIASHWRPYTKGRLVGYDDLRKDLEEEFRRSTVRLDVAKACLEGCEEIRQLTDDIQHQAH